MKPPNSQAEKPPVSMAVATDDIRSIKIKATLAYQCIKYADAEGLFAEALKQTTSLLGPKCKDGKDIPECAQLKEMIATCQRNIQDLLKLDNRR